MNNIVTRLNSMILIFVCILLSGCPAQFKVNLQNNTDKKILIISGYSDVVLSEIDPGKEIIVNYNFDCFRVKFGEDIYEYKTIMPPVQYVKNGMFSSSFKAIFTVDKQLKIFVDSKEKKEEQYLAKGCN